MTLTLKPNSAPEITSAVVTPDSAAAWTPLTFKAVAKDVDGHELSYFWIFPDDNGWPYPFPQVDYTATATHRPLKPGTYTAILRVEDEGYLDVKQEVTYTVGENHAPTVMIKPMTLSKPAPAAFTLIAAGSDQDNQTLSYSWAFSDGTTATGTTVSKTLTAASDLTATVTATDPEGLTATQAVTLTATANHAPTVKLALTGASTRVAPATFAFAASGTDIDGQRLTYSWSFGDATTGSGASIQKAFSTPGTYLVTVTATDPGGLTATASLTVTVIGNRAPVITSAAVTPATATAGTSRRFTVVASDPDKQSIQIKWTFPDGTSSSTAAVSKVFSTPGSYRATVTVTDPGSLATSTTVSFVVS